MDNPVIQVIIPVYNSAKYIKRCLDSLINQTYPYWQALIVNDASSDNSADIVKEYENKDERIKFYSFTENQGVSNIRNFAIGKLTEKYVAFLDSDDYWDDTMLETMINKAEQDNVDVVQCRFIYDYPGNIQKLPAGAFGKDSYIDKKNIKKIYYKMATGINMNHVCMKLIRTEILGDIVFDTKLKTAEDLKFCIQMFLNVNTYCFINKPLYHYCRNEQSITGKGLSGKEKFRFNKMIVPDMLSAIAELGIDTPLLRFLCWFRPYIIIISKIFRIAKEKIFSNEKR